VTAGIREVRDSRRLCRQERILWPRIPEGGFDAVMARMNNAGEA
jgi:hypothetical protein